MGNIFAELKRRNVVRVGIAYVIVGWLVTQVAETIFPTFGAPDWVLKTLIALVAIGFPFALLFAWAFELTPDGIKKTRDVDLSKSLTHSTGRKLDFMIIAALAVALGYFIWERQGMKAATAKLQEQAAASRVAGPDASTVTSPDDRSIAVLPFVNLSSDTEQEWFADGLTEEILNSLARTPDLLVAARTSSFAYKDTEKDIRSVAEELGVRQVLEGSVRRGGDRLRVTAQLIRAEDGFHLWSETYDRPFDDVIEIQEDVAIEIARALETAMDPEALAAMMSAGTRSVPAYEAYLQGQAYGIDLIATGDRYEFLAARDAFERAIELDPEFASAWWELAFFWGLQLQSTLTASGATGLARQEMKAQYDRAIDRAIALESDPVRKLGYRAHKAQRDMKFAQALRLITEVYRNRPNSREIKEQYLDLLGTTRRFDEAVQAAVGFVNSDSLDPILATTSLQQLRFADDTDLMRATTQKAIDRFPDVVNVLYQAHRTLLAAGDIDGGARILPLLTESDMNPGTRLLAGLRQACAERRVADADRLLARHEAAVAAGEIEFDRSIRWLSMAIARGNEAAKEVLRDLDTEEGVAELIDYLGYGNFDPKEFPHLMRVTDGQGVDTDTVFELPYSCNRA